MVGVRAALAANIRFHTVSPTVSGASHCPQCDHTFCIMDNSERLRRCQVGARRSSQRPARNSGQPSRKSTVGARGPSDSKSWISARIGAASTLRSKDRHGDDRALVHGRECVVRYTHARPGRQLGENSLNGLPRTSASYGVVIDHEVVFVDEDCIPPDAVHIIPIDDEMWEVVESYVDLVRSIPGAQFYEQRVPIDHITGEEGGSGTAAILRVTSGCSAGSARRND